MTLSEISQSEVLRRESRRGFTSGRGLGAVLSHSYVVVFLWIGVVVYLGILIHQLPERVNRFDFSIYYASGLMLREGLDPYTTDLARVGRGLELETDPIHYATDPPTFLLVFEPLTWLSLPKAYLVWNSLNLLALVLSLLLLLRDASLDSRLAWSLAALAFLYYPVADNFLFAQNKILILLALVLMIRCMGSDRDRAAGLMLGLAVTLRGFPLLLTGYLILRRRWRVVGYVVAGVLLSGIMTVLILGVTHTLSFSNGLHFVTKDRFLNEVGNISFNAFISRNYRYIFPLVWGQWSEIARRVLAISGGLGFLAFSVKATLKSTSHEDGDWRVFALWVVTSVVLSPTAWVHYLVLALLPFALLARAANEGRASHRAIWMACASYMLPAVWEFGLTAFGPKTIAFRMLGECSFLSLITLYISAYWFATDAPLAKFDDGTET
jgi:hypothetical protein